MTQRLFIAVAVLAVAFATFGGYLLLRPHSPAPFAGEGPLAATSSENVQFVTVGSSTFAIVGKGATVREVPSGSPASEPVPSLPDYRAPISFSASVPATVRATIEAQVGAIQLRIAKNPSDINQWLALGGLYETAGDFANAEKIWTFVTKAWPSDPTAFNNLGNLYSSRLEDYPKAEAMYLKDIALKPNDTNAYLILFTIYTSKYKQGTGAAENILKQGIAGNPFATNLEVVLARHYGSQGRTADARAMYEKAVAAAKAEGNTGLAETIAQEEASL